MNNSPGLLSKTVSRSDIDESIVKIIILGVIGLASSFAFGYFLNLFIKSNNWGYFWIFSIAGTIFLLVFILDTLFIKTFWILGVVVLVESLGVIAGFYNVLSLPVALGFVAMFLMFILGSSLGQDELKNMIKINFFTVSKRALPKAILGLALFGSIAYYNNLKLGSNSVNVSAESFIISKQSFEKIVLYANPIVTKIIPDYDMSIPIGDMARNLAEKQIKSQLGKQFDSLSEVEKKKTIDVAGKEVEKQFSNLLGTEIKPGDSLSENLYIFIVGKFTALSEAGRNNVSFAIALVAFFIVMGFSIPIRMFVTVLSVVLYELLISVGFAAVVLEEREKEIIILK